MPGDPARWFTSRVVDGIAFGGPVTRDEAASIRTRLFSSDSPCLMNRRSDGGWTIYANGRTTELSRTARLDG